MKILITGIAGFIGYSFASRLINTHEIVGIDNFNDYYDVQLKRDRIKQLNEKGSFELLEMNLLDSNGVMEVFKQHQFDAVVHLAAQAGVRYSLSNPKAYIDANITGFLSILEGVRHYDCEHVLFASSSSVYGANTCLPFSAEDATEHPLSLYAATKKANEMMAHSYAHLFDIPVTGMRFFTAYGPWGRPDMALYTFVKAIEAGEPIPLFNGGDMIRDFTYIDDIVEAMVAILDKPPSSSPNWQGQSDSSMGPYRILNLGHGSPSPLMDFVKAIEKATQKEAIIESLGMQPGDVVATHADISPMQNSFNYESRVSIEEGVESFVKWYRAYYK